MYSKFRIHWLMIVMRSLRICAVKQFDNFLKFHCLLLLILAWIHLLKWVWVFWVCGISSQPRSLPKTLSLPFILSQVCRQACIHTELARDLNWDSKSWTGCALRSCGRIGSHEPLPRLCSRYAGTQGSHNHALGKGEGGERGVVWLRWVLQFLLVFPPSVVWLEWASNINDLSSNTL